MVVSAGPLLRRNVRVVCLSMPGAGCRQGLLLSIVYSTGKFQSQYQFPVLRVWHSVIDTVSVFASDPSVKIAYHRAGVKSM